jgi:hypothetical protein
MRRSGDELTVSLLNEKKKLLWVRGSTLELIRTGDSLGKASLIFLNRG